MSMSLNLFIFIAFMMSYQLKLFFELFNMLVSFLNLPSQIINLFIFLREHVFICSLVHFRTSSIHIFELSCHLCYLELKINYPLIFLSAFNFNLIRSQKSYQSQSIGKHILQILEQSLINMPTFRHKARNLISHFLIAKPKDLIFQVKNRRTLLMSLQLPILKLCCQTLHFLL